MCNYILSYIQIFGILDFRTQNTVIHANTDNSSPQILLLQEILLDCYFPLCTSLLSFCMYNLKYVLSLYIYFNITSYLYVVYMTSYTYITKLSTYLAIIYNNYTGERYTTYKFKTPATMHMPCI